MKIERKKGIEKKRRRYKIWQRKYNESVWSCNLGLGFDFCAGVIGFFLSFLFFSFFKDYACASLGFNLSLGQLSANISLLSSLRQHAKVQLNFGKDCFASNIKSEAMYYVIYWISFIPMDVACFGWTTKNSVPIMFSLFYFCHLAVHGTHASYVVCKYRDLSWKMRAFSVTWSLPLI